MTRWLTAPLLILAILFAPTANAEPPSSVTGLQVDFEESDVVLSWEKLSDQDIAYYRVYYSNESILANEGEYDDFEETDGPKGQYTFSNLAPGTILYAAVLAVNASGEESTLFTEEVSISIPDENGVQASSQQSSVASSVRNPTDFSIFNDIVSSQDVPVAPPSSASSFSSISSQSPTPSLDGQSNDGRSVLQNQATNQGDQDRFEGKLHLLSATATSPTEISLVFSSEIMIAPDQAPNAFMISKAGGGELQIQQLIIEGLDVTLRTEAQERNVVYEVQLSEPLAGKNGDPLDATNRKAFFQGHPSGVEPAQPVVQPQSQGREVIGLKLRATPNNNGLYDVTGMWQIPAIEGGVASYLVKQTLDKGGVYTPPQALPGNVSSVSLSGVYPGSFGLFIQTVDQNGVTSDGVLQTVDLAGTPQHPLASIVLPGNPNPTPNQPEPQPQPQPTTPEPTPPQPVNPPVVTVPEPVIQLPANNLPQSGSGFALFTMMFSGILVGWKQSRRYSYS